MKKQLFADRFVAALAKYNVTQAELARRLGVSTSLICDLAHSRHDPERSIQSGVNQIRRIADAIGCDMDDLYKLKEVNYADDI